MMLFKSTKENVISISENQLCFSLLYPWGQFSFHFFFYFSSSSSTAMGSFKNIFLPHSNSLYSTPYYAQTFIFLLSQGESLNFTAEQQLFCFSSSSSLIFDAVGTEYKDKNVFISVITIKAKLLFYVISRQC